MKRRHYDMLIAVLLLSAISFAGICLGLIVPAVGNVRAELAVHSANEAFANGAFESAVANFNEAIRLNPQLARPYHGRGAAYFQLKEYDKALVSYTQAIALEPENDVVFLDRGLAHWHKGVWEDALKDFRRALQINPQSDQACNSLAWALATAPQGRLRDGKKALELAQKACDRTNGQDPFAMSTLAAAYAELGNFPKALEWHKKAMALPNFPADNMERARERLHLYEQGKPYREHFIKQ